MSAAAAESRSIVLKVTDLQCSYPIHGGGLLRRAEQRQQILHGVSFDLARGEALAIIGESGSGKTTLARAVLGLMPVDHGEVNWRGESLLQLSAEEMRLRRRDMQMVFQDPQASLNPRMTIGDILAEPLHTFYPNMASVQVRERVRGMLKMVGLLPHVLNRYAHEFSGGQCQRIAIARALILNPRLLVCDEPVSALDVSIQAQIIYLLKDLQRKLQLSLLFIGHDLALVPYLCDRVMVLYMGEIMELADCDRLYSQPVHPYTRAMLAAIPRPDPDWQPEPVTTTAHDTQVSHEARPAGCIFSHRCPHVQERCRVERPRLRQVRRRQVSCHFAESLMADSDAAGDAS
jgi:oligopeptide transport system ATP-binding protein